jgi:Ser/Thr protein kinase RdoA (MazF antagonist)
VVASERAVTAALVVARAQGLPTERAAVVRDLTNVLVHLAPAPVVARVPITLAHLRGGEWFAEELRLAHHLADAGAPIAPPSSDADPGPHECDGFHITLWRWVDHEPSRADPAAAGRALRELHSALAAYEGELPTCDRLDEVRRLLATFEQTEEIVRLRALADRLDPLDGRPIHGDAHLGNVLWTPEGPLWGDLENVCRGPVEYDLACLRLRPSPEVDAAIAAYGDHDDDAIDAVLPQLTLFLAAWTLVVVERTQSTEAHSEAQRRVRRALAYARAAC